MRWSALFSLVYFIVVVSGSTLMDQIYTKLSQSHPCIRILHSEGTIGCTTPKEGLEGTLRYFEAQVDVDNFLKATAPSYKVAAVIKFPLFTSANLEQLGRHVALAGIMVLHPDNKEVPVTWSPARPSPQPETSLHPEYAWNPAGTSMSFESFQYAIIQLSLAESQLVLPRAAANEENIAAGAVPDHRAQLKYKMFAEENSKSCLTQGTCQPLGGLSVWAGLGTADSRNYSRPTILATAAFDSSAFFHQLSVGGDSAMSGLVALVGAADALERAGVSSMGPDSLRKQIIFSAFAGESWGFVGSRRWLQEIEAFRCEEAADDGSCFTPYRPDTEFTSLSLDHFERVLDFTQLALLDPNNSTVYMHREKPSNPQSDAMVADLRKVAEGMGLQVEDASASTPGLPPSSAQSFVRARPAIGAVALADHAAAFENRFHHSQFDDYDNIQGNPEDLRAPHLPLCMASTLGARALYRAAAEVHSQTVEDSIEADCSVISQLWTCLTKDMSCPLFSQLSGTVLGSLKDKPVAHYTSVYQPYVDRSRLRGTAGFINQLFAHLPLNWTELDVPQKSDNIQVHYHDALDPELTFNPDTRVYDIRNASASPLWSESNWGTDFGARIYRVETDLMAYVMLGSGCAVLLFSLLGIKCGLRSCQKRLKTL